MSLAFELLVGPLTTAHLLPRMTATCESAAQLSSGTGTPPDTHALEINQSIAYTAEEVLGHPVGNAAAIQDILLVVSILEEAQRYFDERRLRLRPDSSERATMRDLLRYLGIPMAAGELRDWLDGVPQGPTSGRLYTDELVLCGLLTADGTVPDALRPILRDALEHAPATASTSVTRWGRRADDASAAWTTSRTIRALTVVCATVRSQTAPPLSWMSRLAVAHHVLSALGGRGEAGREAGAPIRFASPLFDHVAWALVMGGVLVPVSLGGRRAAFLPTPEADGMLSTMAYWYRLGDVANGLHDLLDVPERPVTTQPRVRRKRRTPRGAGAPAAPQIGPSQRL